MEALASEYRIVDHVIMSLSQDELTRQSGCSGWTDADLIFHMLLDPQRALVAFNSPTSGPADRDFVTYWQSFIAADERSQAHARFVRMSAAAYQDAKTICSLWHETAEAAIRCASESSDIPFVTTQDHVLTTPDFIATLVLEAAIHHLDLVTNLDDKPRPAESALSITTRTLDGLLGRPKPSSWDEVTYILKATGRQPLTHHERLALREASDSFPLFS